MTSSCARHIIHITALASFLLLVAMVTRSVDGNKGKCPLGKFGQHCILTCNCRNNVDCDDVTGMCPASCSEGWSGPSCQRQNVALGMATDMKTYDWSKGARAVDGDAGTCVTSSSNRTGWWCVDLLVQRTVFFMEILFANQSARPGRIRVHVSDYVDTFWGKPCTSIPASHKTTYFSCDLPSSGRYFGIINKEGQITLCEVSVFVCAHFTFGLDCSNQCACADPNEFCNGISGTCITGCRDGYMGADCTKPCSGRYGKACSHMCGHCYDNQQCDHVTGMCPEGCAPGWTGSWCNQHCESGTYGIDCRSRCHHCLDNVTCHAASGLCPWRCEPGWTGHRCNIECESGWHGSNCEFPCGHCYKNSVCDRQNGVCSLGCDPGHDGLFCTSECMPGHWGPNCQYTCGHCHSRACNLVTGHCSNRSCRAGWSGPRCDVTCRPGFYGRNCAMVCRHCQSQCDAIDGACPTQCLPGYTGRTCVDTCSNNTYGLQCASKCGHCAGSGSCHHATGYCLRGCAEGYTKPLCLLRAGTLLDQLGKANLPTLLMGCMAVFCSTICCIISCLLFKYHQENASASIFQQPRERHFQQTVV